MTYNQAKNLLTKNIENMTLEQLQKHKIALLDAWRHSEGFFGEVTAVKNGFYLVLASESAKGYTPRDIWLTTKLKARYYETEKREMDVFSLQIFK